MEYNAIWLLSSTFKEKLNISGIQGDTFLMTFQNTYLFFSSSFSVPSRLFIWYAKLVCIVQNRTYKNLVLYFGCENRPKISNTDVFCSDEIGPHETTK